MARRKRNLIKQIQKELGLSSYREADEIFEKTMKVFRSVLEEDGELKLPDIGIIKKVVKGGRKVRVPRTGEEIYAPKRFGLRIQEAARFKEAFI